jgi:F-type H+-transporting ATPase subunit gamma
METLEKLQRRIEISRDLQSIVRTMKTLSAVTVRHCERASHVVRAYDETVDLGLQIVLRDPPIAKMAIKSAEDTAKRGPVGTIVVGSDHGLCGRYNDAVVDAAREDIASYDSDALRLAVVGTRAAGIMEAGRRKPDIVYSAPGSVSGISEITATLLALIDIWQRVDGIGRLRIVHNTQSSENRPRPVAMSLLPISAAFLRHQAQRPWPSRRLPTYTEDRHTLLAQLLRQHVFVRIYRALAEAQASEHAARLSAMQAAERGIRDHLSEMDFLYRQKRQEQITTELLDVVTGSLILEAEDR